MSATIRFISAVLLLALGGRAAGAYAQELCYAYDVKGELVAVVDQQGQTAIYDYDAAGNTMDIRRNDATGPVAITFVSPATAAGDAQIQLLGTGFSSDPSEDDVTIGGVSATVLSANSCSVTAIVPPGALAGPGSIQVTTPSGAATYTGSFTLLALGLIVSPSPADAVLKQSIGFAATVTGTADQRVTWSVNGFAGGDSTTGIITAAGFYTAPAAVPPGVNVTIQATSVGFPSITGDATVTIVSTANGYASTAVSVQFGVPPLSVLALPVSVQFGPLSPGGANAAPVSVAFGPFPSGVVLAAPVSVANAPVIGSVVPSSAAQGATPTLTLTGSNFTGATALAFVLNGTQDTQITATNITVSPDGTQLTAHLAIGVSAGLGAHVVVVRTATGISNLESTGTNGFTVTVP